MTQNKFLLVWSPQGKETPKKRYETKEKAIDWAKKLAESYPKQDVFVLYAVHHFKANVEVIETNLNTLETDFVDFAEPTTDETPKHNFKVGDIVIVNHCDNKEEWIDDMFEILNKKEKHKITKIEATKEYMYCTLDELYEFNAKCLLKSE